MEAPGTDLKGRSWKMAWKRIGHCLYTGNQPSEVVDDTWLNHHIWCGKKWSIHQEFLEFPHLKSGSHKHLAMSKAKKYLPKTILQTSTFLYVVTSCDVLVNLKISKKSGMNMMKNILWINIWIYLDLNTDAGLFICITKQHPKRSWLGDPAQPRDDRHLLVIIRLCLRGCHRKNPRSIDGKCWLCGFRSLLSKKNQRYPLVN